ncbi:root allergen protein-like [Bidens hawaiensis]|uniref:root allergen protein-like n=1 Tax=Bidens hawaiensis TaxID=980011 RepID=UPI004049DA61
MSSATLQVEIPSKYPADKIFKTFSDFDNIAPKVKPEVFKSIETVEGNGDVGTIKTFTFGDAVPFTTGKYKVDALDVSNYSFSYSFIDGDILMGILNSISYNVKVVPSSDGGSVFQQTVTYNYKGDEKLSEEILKKEKETHEETYKAIEAYVAAQA